MFFGIRIVVIDHCKNCGREFWGEKKCPRCGKKREIFKQRSSCGGGYL